MPSSAMVKCENVLLDYFLALYTLCTFTHKPSFTRRSTDIVNRDFFFSEMRVITIMDVVRPGHSPGIAPEPCAVKSIQGVIIAPRVGYRNLVPNENR